MQLPVLLHGAAMLGKRCIFSGAAIVFARVIASSTLFTTLLIPAATITCFGPKIIAATLLP
jgi:hypothetical protein